MTVVKPVWDIPLGLVPASETVRDRAAGAGSWPLHRVSSPTTPVLIGLPNGLGLLAGPVVTSGPASEIVAGPSGARPAMTAALAAASPVSTPGFAMFGSPADILGASARGPLAPAPLGLLAGLGAGGSATTGPNAPEAPTGALSSRSELLLLAWGAVQRASLLLPAGMVPSVPVPPGWVTSS